VDAAERILREFDTIAVVGASRDPNKAASEVPEQLQRAGYRIVPVNPHADVLLGERVYRSLSDIPFPVELVLVFRPSAETAAVAQQAVAIGAKGLWLQQGIASEEARRIAEGGGLLYVEDSCAAVLRSRLGIRKH
jgi:predicted CoA-binding protein